MLKLNPHLKLLTFKVRRYFYLRRRYGVMICRLDLMFRTLANKLFLLSKFFVSFSTKKKQQ